MAFMVGGVALSAMVSGTIASIFVERRIREGKGLQDVRLKGHTIVCGWNSHAGSVLSGLEAESPSTPVILINSMDAEGFDAIKAGHPGLDLRLCPRRSNAGGGSPQGFGPASQSMHPFAGRNR